MKTSTRKVYQCDHCKKNMLSASSMSRHEKYCRLNPENKHKCFEMCRYLKRDLEFIDKAYPASVKTVFKCSVIGKKMYSYLLEKKLSFKPEFTIGSVRMPLDCKFYKEMTLNEQELRFNPNEETY